MWCYVLVQWVLVCLNSSLCVQVCRFGLGLFSSVMFRGVSYIVVFSRKVGSSYYSVCVGMVGWFSVWLCQCYIVYGSSISSGRKFMFLVIVFMLVVMLVIYSVVRLWFFSRWCSRFYMVRVVIVISIILICVCLVISLNCRQLNKVSMVYYVMWWFYRCWVRFQVSYSVSSVVSSDGIRKVRFQLLNIW